MPCCWFSTSCCRQAVIPVQFAILFPGAGLQNTGPWQGLPLVAYPASTWLGSELALSPNPSCSAIPKAREPKNNCCADATQDVAAIGRGWLMSCFLQHLHILHCFLLQWIIYWIIDSFLGQWLYFFLWDSIWNCVGCYYVKQRQVGKGYGQWCLRCFTIFRQKSRRSTTTRVRISWFTNPSHDKNTGFVKKPQKGDTELAFCLICALTKVYGRYNELVNGC